MYQDTESNYLSILTELKEIKDLLDFFIEPLTIKQISHSNIKIYIQLIKIEQLVIKYINHISPDNISLVFNLFLNSKSLTNDDNDKILFLTKFLRPICVWDSNYHKKEIILNNINNDNKKLSVLTKDLIETLLGIKKDENKNNEIIMNIRIIINKKEK
jgi:hypothetical protein